jgi:pyruvate formate lyase activating enzyme
MIEARIFNLERFALDDGPGIRTIVFLQGCPLHCPWCSNPESQPFGGGYMRSVSDIMDEVERDKGYYDASGGGVTFSGGECLAQPQALLALVKEAKSRGIQTALETTVSASQDTILKLLPYVDLWLIDIKHTDAESLKKTTGLDIEFYSRNIDLIDPEKIVLRRPCIPGFNMETKQFEDAFNFALNKGIRRMDLIPFHTLGAEIYRRMGKGYPYAGVPALDKKALEPFKDLGLTNGIDTRIL